MANMLHVIKIKKRVSTIAYLSRFLDSRSVHSTTAMYCTTPLPHFDDTIAESILFSEWMDEATDELANRNVEFTRCHRQRNKVERFNPSVKINKNKPVLAINVNKPVLKINKKKPVLKINQKKQAHKEYEIPNFDEWWAEALAQLAIRNEIEKPFLLEHKGNRSVSESIDHDDEWDFLGDTIPAERPESTQVDMDMGDLPAFESHDWVGFV
jgi:hypothetical protein